jgi:hypothetical protein
VVVAGAGEEAGGRAASEEDDEAAREAQRAVQGARSRGHAADAGSSRDREVTGSDLTIRAGENVRDASAVKGNLRLEAGATARDAAAVMGHLTLDAGAKVRDAVAVLGDVKLSGGASAREAVAVLGDVDIGPGAEVEQDVISVGGQVRVDPTARVGGSTHSFSFPSLPRLSGDFTIHLLPSPFSLLIETLVRFAVLFVLGLVVLAVAPRRLETVSGSMVAGPWRSLLAGVVGSVGMLVLTVLLAVTVVGLLLIPVQVLMVLAGGVLGVTALTHHLGRVLPFPPSRRTMVLELAAGTLIFSVAAAIPVLGAMVWVATWFLAFGAVLRTRFGQPPAALPTTPVPPAAGVPA